jgi:hypothetical protein
VLFVPDAPLAPLETYQVQVTHGCGTYNTSFTTEAAATPVEAGEMLGLTYQLSLAEGNWVEPIGVGDLIASQLGDASLLLEVTAVGIDTFDLLMAPGTSEEQDLCSTTTDLLGIDFSANPSFALELEPLVMDVSSIEFQFDSTRITGRVSGSTSLTDLSLTGITDTRPLVESFGLEGGDSTLCDLVSTFGVSCLPCDDGSGSYCLLVIVDTLAAEPVATDLVSLTAADVAADPDCQ